MILSLLRLALPRRRGSPTTISVKFFVDVNGWPRYQRCRNIAENFNRLSRVHERYRRQTYDRQMTDGRATAHSEREREFTIGKNYKRTAVDTLIGGVQYIKCMPTGRAK